MRSIATSLTAAILAAGLPIFPQSLQAQDAAPRRDACEVGERLLRQYISEAKGAPRLLSDRANLPQPLTLQPVAGAPADFPKTWDARGRTNLFAACPNLKVLLPDNVRFATSDEWAATKAVNQDRFVEIEEFSAPLVSGDGRLLVIQHSGFCPGLCGHATLELYRREGAGWSGPERLLTRVS